MKVKVCVRERERIYGFLEFSVSLSFFLVAVIVS